MTVTMITCQIQVEAILLIALLLPADQSFDCAGHFRVSSLAFFTERCWGEYHIGNHLFQSKDDKISHINTVS